MKRSKLIKKINKYEFILNDLKEIAREAKGLLNESDRVHTKVKKLHFATYALLKDLDKLEKRLI